MKLLPLVFIPILAFSLTGCGVEGIARNAADATACKALTSTLNGITTAYQSGLVDSGLISKVNNLVGEQARALLSTGLAEDLALLGDVMSQTQSAQASQEKVGTLTASISERCSAVGVEVGE